VWDKQVDIKEQWIHGQYELLLIGVRGKHKTPSSDIRVTSVYSEKRGNHSAKPIYYYDVIEQMFPEGKLLELFSDIKHNDKWTVWGNQSPIKEEDN
jgi:N6-adenosine-specific RNA methylase IME4